MRGARVPLALVALLALLGCEARLTLGAGCARSGECASPLVCAAGRCRSECVEHADCALGARCVLDTEGLGRCTLPDDPDCREPGQACAAGLLCLGGECLNPCGSLAECPGGSVCATGPEGLAYCERADVDAGPGPDAGAGDAAADAAIPCGPLPGCERAVELALTAHATCVRGDAGSVWCWGFADEIAPGEVSPDVCPSSGYACSPVPVRARLEEPGSRRDVSGATFLEGSAAAFAAVIDGRAFTWGAAWTGALGAPGDGRYAREVRLAPDGATFLPGGVTEVALGERAGIAMRASRPWHAWGREDYAQRGEGVGTGSDFAEETAGPAGASTVRFGHSHGCALVAGRAWCWGENDAGQAGDSAAPVVETPAEVVGLPVDDARDVEPGFLASCTLVSGDVWCWGHRSLAGNAVEPPGCRDTVAGARACPPAPVLRGAMPFVDLSLSPTENWACAVDAGRRVWCWGAGVADEPVVTGDFAASGAVSDVAVGGGHVCVIVDGDVRCLGGNANGELGTGLADVAPVEVFSPVVWP